MRSSATPAVRTETSFSVIVSWKALQVGGASVITAEFGIAWELIAVPLSGINSIALVPSLG